MAESSGVASSRPRRQRADASGRLAALDKLRGLKGAKYKYEVDKVSDVWNDIDEKEYSKLVRERQDDDWIVDDDGQGYVEDGREIFDDEHLEDDRLISKKKRQKIDSNSSHKGKLENVTLNGTVNMRNKDLKSMFTSMPHKKKSNKNVKLEDDILLDDILQDLQKESPAQLPLIKPTILRKKSIPGETISPSPNIGHSKLSKNSQSSKSQTPTRVPLVKPIRRRQMTYEEELLPYSALSGNIKVEDTNDDMSFDSELITEYDSEQFISNEKEDKQLLGTVDDSSQKPQPELESHQSTISQNGVDDSVVFADDDDIFKSDWEEICGQTSKNSFVCPEPSLSVMKQSDIQLDSLKLPLEANENGDNVLRFFWIDAYEDYFKNPGVVFLFGKVWVDSAKMYISCCVTIRNIERKIFVLPREYKRDSKAGVGTEHRVNFSDVHAELSNLLTDRFKIMKFRCKKVTKHYCFDKVDVPNESEYLEVRYSALDKSLPPDLQGETFSHIFGTNTSSLEQVVLDQHIMGPCWLEVKNPQPFNPSLSWCKLEVVTERPENVVVIQKNILPPLVLMAFGLKTVVNPKTHQNEIVTVSCLVHSTFCLDKSAPNPPFQEYFCALTRPSDCVFPFDFKDRLKQQNQLKVEKADSERALLGYVMAKIQMIDPDIIMGHDIVNFDFDVLLHRLQVNKIPNWSRLGRLRRTVVPKFNLSFKIGGICCGRLLCDVKILAKELLRSKSYDLTELVKTVLKKDRIEMDAILAFSSSQQLLKFIEWGLLDVSYCLQIIYEISALPLALQITNIAGNILSRTLLGGRSERNEFLLLHAFVEKGYIVPDKAHAKSSKVVVDDGIDDIDILDSAKTKKASSHRRKAAYIGGLVLEPKRGFYDKYILLMDFNSLYPSIIQEFNVCFTTVPRLPMKDTTDEEDVCVMPDTGLPPGVLPTEIRKLVESRRQVKQLLKSPDLSSELKNQYDIRQKALKLTANSMYGCLGFSNSRFYAKALAAFVTSKGREILLQTKDLVQKINLDVIYGDTDSLMINTNSTDLDQVWKIGNKLKQEINKLYCHLEIEVDGIFKSMLLLKKKKYAALSIQCLPNGEIATSEEIKGVDIVRRDWSDLACDAGRFVIREILSDKPRDQILDSIQSYLCQLKTNVMDGKVSFDKLTITKQLTKNPEDYTDKKALPHVNVAIRLNSKGGKQIRQGDAISYVVCEDGSSLPATQRAYHLTELKSNENLKIDKQYYLGQQVHPVVSRLCDPIDGMDAACIAECLGLDPSSYRSQKNGGTCDAEEDAMLGGGEPHLDKERFEECENFKFNCPAPDCKCEIVFDSPFYGEGIERVCALSRCSNASCKTSPATYTGYLCNQLTRSIRLFIQKYYQGFLICDDPICQGRTRKLPLRFHRGQPICSTCGKGSLHPEYTDRQLYNQLCFYQHIFDPDKVVKSFKPDERDAVRHECHRLQQEYGRLRATVTRFLNTSAYSVVDLAELFGGLYPSRSALK